MRPLPCLWIFIAKLLGAYVLPKARCVALGDLRRPYLDFDPDGLHITVARQENIRLLLANASAQCFLLETHYIRNAYLFGDLDEPSIMEQPRNSTRTGYVPGKVLSLQKSIHGSKQAGHVWGSFFHKEPIRLRFKQSSTDSRFYPYKSSSGFVILVVVVEEVLMTSDSRSLFDDSMKKVKRSFT